MYDDFLSSLPWVPARSVVESKSRMPESRLEPGFGGIKRGSLEYLFEIAAQPNETVTERDRRLRLGGSKGNRLRKELIAADLIRQVSFTTGRQGRVTILEFTPKGKALLVQLAVKINQRGRGGVEHRWWQSKIKEWLDCRGWKAYVEDSTGGKAVDVIATKDGLTVAYEVVCENKMADEVGNVGKDLAVADEVVVCCKTQVELGKHRDRVSQEGIFVDGRVSWKLLSSFLD